MAECKGSTSCRLAMLGTCIAGFAVASTPPPTFDVDLQLAPRHRYRGAVRRILEIHSAEFSFAPVFSHWNATFWHQFPESVFMRTARALQKYFPEHAEEMSGVAEELRDNGIAVSFEYLSAWAYRHELQHASTDGLSGLAACSGIVVQGPDGSIRHGRNEDLEPRVARNLTLSLRFLGPGAEPLLRGTDWYWFTTGLRTAMRPRVASISGNFRFAPPRPLGDVLSEIGHGVMPDMLLFRSALLDAGVGSFEPLLKHLASVPVATPSYYVVAGTRAGEGAVVARAPVNGTAGSRVLRMGSEDIVGKPPPWALVQSNYDLWEADHREDPRRTVATNLLAAYGQDLGASALGLYAALSTYPVHNEDTAYTTTMSAGTGEFTSFMRMPIAPAPAEKKCWEACCKPESVTYGTQCAEGEHWRGSEHPERFQSELLAV
mmetsp:Transcript_68414/g.216432  ORF Transcript_68414/g.216432 Transcript_68414/m.216432 type:complete len:432 (-) Transcript_68414:24-1319(-)